MKAYIVINTETNEVFKGASGKAVFTTKSASKNSWNQKYKVYHNDYQDIKVTSWEVLEFELDINNGRIVT